MGAAAGPHLVARAEIPAELDRRLPWWLRGRANVLASVLAVAAIVAGYLDHLVAAAVLIGLAIVVSLSAFWVGRVWLSRRGLWPQGLEHLSRIHAVRGALVLALVVGGAGTYLVLGADWRGQPVVGITVGALALIVPFYVWGSLEQGFIGNEGDVNFVEEEPARYWVGLATYSLLMGLAAAVLIFLVLRA